jgi:hypothetical protein
MCLHASGDSERAEDDLARDEEALAIASAVLAFSAEEEEECGQAGEHDAAEGGELLGGSGHHLPLEVVREQLRDGALDRSTTSCKQPEIEQNLRIK